MDGDILTSIYILCGFVLFSAFFSATETAFSSMNRIRMKTLAQEGNKRAALALKLSEKYDSLLSSVLIGNNIVNIAASSFATTLFVKHFGANGVSISTAVMTVVILIFGEISPKSIAKDSPEKFAMFAAGIMNIFIIIFYPLNMFFTLWKKLLSKVFKSGENKGITEEEILTMVEEAESGGEFDTSEGELIRNAIEFNDIEVIDIHTPRVEVVAVDINDSRKEVEEAFFESGFSRLPVYSETIDNIVGVITMKDFSNPANAERKLTDLINPPVFVIPSMKISKLLTLLQKNKSHMAIIADEYGGTVGIVTLEDILEELVGEIWDEHDEVIEEFVKISDKEYRVLCSADLDDMFDKFNIEKTVDASTVSGWVTDELKKIPEKGDSFEIENYIITVSKCDSRHVLEIIVKEKDPEIKEEMQDERLKAE